MNYMLYANLQINSKLKLKMEQLCNLEEIEKFKKYIIEYYLEIVDYNDSFAVDIIVI